MSKNQKIFLIVLAVLVILYLVSVFIGVSQPKTQGDEDPSESSWASSLDGLMSSFAPRVDVSKLKCGNTAVKDYFFLDFDRKSCEIKLAKGLVGEKDFWKTDVLISQRNGQKPEVYFVAKYAKDESKLPRPKDKDCAIRSADDVVSPLWLEIEMVPDDDKEKKIECWLKAKQKNTVGITITGPGKVLLTCFGCTEESKQSIKMKFKP